MAVHNLSYYVKQILRDQNKEKYIIYAVATGLVLSCVHNVLKIRDMPSPEKKVKTLNIAADVKYVKANEQYLDGSLIEVKFRQRYFHFNRDNSIAYPTYYANGDIGLPFAYDLSFDNNHQASLKLEYLFSPLQGNSVHSTLEKMSDLKSKGVLASQPSQFVSGLEGYRLGGSNDWYYHAQHSQGSSHGIYCQQASASCEMINKIEDGLHYRLSFHRENLPLWPSFVSYAQEELANYIK